MKKGFLSIILLIAVMASSSILKAAENMHDGQTGINHDMAASHDGISHSAMAAGTYKQAVVVDDIRAEFQVMSLASMNMSDPEGATHHIMVKFSKNKMNHQIKDVIGKIKIISPSKKEQTAALKNYGNMLAANFTFDEPGKWGIICLFKVDGQKHLAKFWYPHK